MNLQEAGEILRTEIGAPLVVFDLETTGLDTETDRIVEISLVQLAAAGDVETWTQIVNPGVSIPPDASRVHGITDAMVADARPFAAFAPELALRLNGMPLVGYNGASFDVPLLAAEMERAGVAFTPGPVIDPMLIWKKLEGRSLAAALHRFAGEQLEEAHSAEADTIACLKALAGMMREFHGERIPDPSPAGLAEFVREPDWVDEAGKIRWVEGVACMGFGRHRNKPLVEMVANEADYLKWILTSDFHVSTKSVIQTALEGAADADV